MPTDNWRDDCEQVLRDIPDYDPWALRGDAYLDHHAAIDAINFFDQYVKHVEGSTRGAPFTLRRWQAAIVGNLFGWKRLDARGREVRRYRRALIYVPRGNGKTPLAAGIVLTAFFQDVEFGQQNYLAAGKAEQAAILFRNIRGMIEQDKTLYNSVRIYGGASGQSARTIVKRSDPLSFIRVIPADAAGQHGGIPHVTVVDELHAQKNRDLMDVFETAMAKDARPQPMLVMITTADFDRPSICNEIFDYACKVRDNGGATDRPGHDAEFLPVIYAAGDKEDWHDDDLLKRVNPNIGVSVSLKDVQRLRRKAEEVPAFAPTFRRLHMNQRTSATQRLVPMKEWDLCDNIDLRPGDLLGKRCFAGFDLASIEDLATFALLFPLADERLAALFWCFCPEARIIDRARRRIPYDVWAKQGHLIATPGEQIDYYRILDVFDEQVHKYSVVDCGVDPHDATLLMQMLIDRYGSEFCWKVHQSFANMSAPFKHLLRAVKGRKLAHFGHPVARWAASNTAGYFRGTIPSGENLEDHLDKVPVMPSKQRSADKIDPITALTIAAARMLASPGGTDADDTPPLIMVV